MTIYGDITLDQPNESLEHSRIYGGVLVLSEGCNVLFCEIGDWPRWMHEVKESHPGN